MITKLLIQNYALIEQTQINLSSGFSVITGGSGAGKSILLSALNLLLGARADVTTLRNEQQKCIVEAEFNIQNYGLQELFNENEVDYDDNTIIRREILPTGKSRAFINDQPVAITTLKSIACVLLDIHSQHQNQLLTNNSYQLNLIDSMAKSQQQLVEYQQVYNNYSQLHKQLNNLIEQNKTAQRDLDYLKFQLSELKELNLCEGEIEELESEAQRLEHSEEIQTNATEASQLLSDNHGIITKLGQLKNVAQKLEQFLPSDTNATERIEQAVIDLKDLAYTFNSSFSDIDADPQRLDYINSRITKTESLLKKHSLADASQLIQLQAELQTKVNNIQNFDDVLIDLKNQISECETLLKSKADALTAIRQSVFEDMQNYITAQLHSMGISSPQFIISNQKQPFGSNGQDDIDFLFAANKNSTPQPICKIASGGEIARVMLSIKSLMCKAKSMPTIIFDEIDTGVSGEVADAMGKIMKQIAENTQVIAITHLPQVASKGLQHFKVYKADEAESTVSHIKLLDQNERITEIAQMLSGKIITDAALLNAKQLLDL